MSIFQINFKFHIWFHFGQHDSITELLCDYFESYAHSAYLHSKCFPWLSYARLYPDDFVSVRYPCELICLFAPCRNGWILCHCWIPTAENEKSGRHENVSSPDPHACSCSRLCGWSHDCWYVTFSNLLGLFQFE